MTGLDFKALVEQAIADARASTRAIVAAPAAVTEEADGLLDEAMAGGAR